MSPGLRRCVAELVCRALQASLPARLQPWGWAVRYEVAEIPDDTRALLFALDSLGGLLPRAIAIHLFHALAALAGTKSLSSGDRITMAFYTDAVRRPRFVGIACAIGAVSLGLAYMAIAGAPMRYLGVNAGALVIGLGLLAAIGRMMLEARRWPGAPIMMMAVVLLATALLGDRVDGAARWFRLGALFIQPSLVLLPVMILGFARSRNALSAIGMIGAAAALAIQPDRAMAGMLAAGLTVLAVMRPDRLVIPALAASIVGFAVTLIRADTLPAVPYVDQILYSAFDVHAFAGLAVLGGSVLLIVPAIVGRLYDVDNREAYSVFGIVWLAGIIAAALGNYPTPIVGYGGSAVLGYVLSLTMLPKAARSCLGAEVTLRNQAGTARATDRHLCLGLAYSA
jgi:cell division protein FtsW (lipid II flippase)